MRLSGQSIWLNYRDYVMIIVGVVSYCFGFCAFILPEQVVIGGLTGFGTLLMFVTQRLFGYGVPLAFTHYGMNLLLLAIAYKTVGKTFVLRTIYGATLIALTLGVMQPLFTTPLITGNPMMSILIGGIFIGMGLGIVFVHNGSTGGTDIVAAMVSKRSNVSVGRTMIYCDFCIICSSFFLFHSVDKVVYGLMVTFLAGYLTDMLINTNRQAVQFTIFSNKWQEIATAINNEAHRGCTVLTGMGWYTKSDVHMLIVMCRKIEQVTIFRIIKSIDPHSFVTQANVNGVYGKGFDSIKMKMAPHNEQGATTSAGDSPAPAVSDTASAETPAANG